MCPLYNNQFCDSICEKMRMNLENPRHGFSPEQAQLSFHMEKSLETKGRERYKWFSQGSMFWFIVVAKITCILVFCWPQAKISYFVLHYFRYQLYPWFINKFVISAQEEKKSRFIVYFYIKKILLHTDLPIAEFCVSSILFMVA